MIPKSYKKNIPICQNCKYLINSYFCAFNETKSHEELLDDPNWKYNNEVYLKGGCDMFEEQTLQDSFCKPLCRHCATQTELDEYGFCENCIRESMDYEAQLDELIYLALNK